MYDRGTFSTSDVDRSKNSDDIGDEFIVSKKRGKKKIVSKDKRIVNKRNIHKKNANKNNICSRRA